MKFTHCCLTAVAFWALAGAPPVLSGNWPSWRGPEGNGICPEKNVPTHWNAQENVKWRIDLPERCNSTPIVWNDRIFLTQPIENEQRRLLRCYDRDAGALLWENGVTYAKPDPTHRTNPYCSASPVTDGERIIVWFGSAGVYCYDFEGKQVWGRELGVQDHIWGTGSSPVLDGDKVFLNFGPGNREFLIALDKRTGETLWEKPPPHAAKNRGKDVSEDLHGSWSTPLPVKNEGSKELSLAWPHRVVAYDPETGNEKWWCGGLGDLVYANPMWGNGVLVCMGGYHGPTIALKPDGGSDITASGRLWRTDRSELRLGTGIIHDGHIYITNMGGIAECQDLATGETVWRERLQGRGGTGDIWSSVVRAGDNLYVMNKGGDTFVFKAKPEFELVSVNSLGEATNSSTVISDGEIFIRTHEGLWRIGEE